MTTPVATQTSESKRQRKSADFGMAARADTACRDPDNASDSNGLRKVATAPPGLRIYIQLIIQNEVFGILRPCKIDTCQVSFFYAGLLGQLRLKFTCSRPV